MKRLRWSTLKRHIALTLTIVAAVLIIAALVLVRGAKEHGTYEITHLYGDPSVMEGITISGAIQDEHHRTSFAWLDDHVDTKTEVFAKPQRNWTYHYRGMYERINDYYYTVHLNSYKGLKIERNSLHHNRWEHSEYIEMELPIARLFYKESYSSDDMRRLSYGLAEVEGELYITLVTTTGYEGVNWIYKLNSDQWSKSMFPFESVKPTPIMSYRSDRNDIKDTTQTAVLGLEAVGDILALILVRDDKLVIEGYHTDGKKLGETAIVPFIFEEFNDELADGDNYASYGVGYEAYHDAENGMLTLSFLNQQSQRTAVTVQCTEDGIKLIDVTELKKVDKLLRGYSESLYDERFIAFKAGKLYEAGVYREINQSDNNVWYRLLPIRLLVHVYERGELVYAGELMTDVNDDLVRMKNQSTQNLNYSDAEYRNLFDLHID